MSTERLRVLRTGCTACCLIGHRNGDRLLDTDYGVSMFAPDPADLAFVTTFGAVHVGQSSGLDDHLPALAGEARLSYDLSTKLGHPRMGDVAPLRFLALRKGARGRRGGIVAGRRSVRVSIIDVAREAGVSTATAGRMLGGNGYASEEVRERVAAAAAELGYRPNRLAKGLITGATQTLGVVAADVSDAFYASVLRSVSDVARRAGSSVIVTSSDEDGALETAAVELFLEKRVDGIILSPVDLSGAPHLLGAARAVPVVQIDRVAANLPADSVTVDNVGGARACVERLLRAGHRVVGFVAELLPGGADPAAFLGRSAPPDPLALYPSRQRPWGYLEAHRAAGVPVEPRLIRPVGLYSAEAARAQVLDPLRAPSRPTGLLTADGTMSRGVIEAIGALGLAVPADLSLICFDDLDWMRFWGPGLSAAGQPVRRMGEAAAEMMLDRIRGKDGPPRRVVLP